MGRWAGRLAAVAVGTVAALTVATAAFAHVEVEADPAVAGAANAVLTFSAEAESPTSGIKSVEIVLPAGIAPADVTLTKAPAGWKLRPTATGYVVAGAALPKGKNAVHAVRVTRLPNQTTLVFKALVTYANGDIDRWIEEPSTANPNPDHPTPILKLKAGPSPTAAPTTTVPPTTAPAVTASVTLSPAAATPSGSSAWVWWVLIALLVAAAVLAVLLARRRRAS
jgi:Domain of unkown function (DUF1775)